MIKADLSEPMYFEHDMSINVSYGHYYSHFSYTLAQLHGNSGSPVQRHDL